MKSLAIHIFIIASVVFLTACGGGGGGTSNAANNPSGIVDSSTANAVDENNISALEQGNSWMYKNIHKNDNFAGNYDYLGYMEAEITERLGSIYQYEYRTITRVEDKTEREYLGTELGGLAIYGPLEDTDFENTYSDDPLSYYAFFDLESGQSRSYTASDLNFNEDLDGDALFEKFSIRTSVRRGDNTSLETYAGIIDDVQLFNITLTFSIEASAGENATASESFQHWRAPGIGVVKELSDIHDVEIMGYKVGGENKGFTSLNLIIGAPFSDERIYNPVFIKGEGQHLLAYQYNTDTYDNADGLQIRLRLLDENGGLSDTDIVIAGANASEINGIVGVWYEDHYKVIYRSNTFPSGVRMLSINSSGEVLGDDPLGELLFTEDTTQLGIATDGTEILVLGTGSGEPDIPYLFINESGELSDLNYLSGRASLGDFDYISTPGIIHDGEDFYVIYSTHDTDDWLYILRAQKVSNAPSNEDVTLAATEGRWGPVQVFRDGENFQLFSGTPYTDNVSLLTLDFTGESVAVSSLEKLTEEPLLLGTEEIVYFWKNYMLGEGARAQLNNGESYVVWANGVGEMMLGAHYYLTE